MIIAIDPGKTGGIAKLSDEGNVLSYITTPIVSKEIDWEEFAQLIRPPSANHKFPPHVFLEHVHAMHGVAANTTFEFGGAFHGAKALIAAYRLPFTLVAPKVWQKEMWQGVAEIRKPPKKLSKKELKAKAEGKKVRTPNAIGARDTKAMSLVAARRLFPQVDFKITPMGKSAVDGIVDALLLAEYGRRLLK